MRAPSLTKRILSRSIAGVLTLTLVTGLGTIAAPQRADAQLAVIDPAAIFQLVKSAVIDNQQITKENVLDPLAWVASKKAVQSVVKSQVNFVNSGFNGSPAFVTDLNKTLQSVGDAQADAFLKDLESNSSINSPFRDTVTQGLRQNYFRSTGSDGFVNQNAYTLGAEEDPNGFGAMFSSFVRPENNPFGFSLLAEQAVQSQVGTAQNTRLTELGWGDGFSSQRANCPSIFYGDVSLGGVESTCASSTIQTPGSVIKDQLNHSLGSGIDQLTSADEFNEIIDSLFGQLTTKVLGDGGLSGVSKPASGGGTSYIDQSTSQNNSNIGALFAQSLTEQNKQVESFRANWQRIGDAAQNAKTTCESRGRQDIVSSDIQPVITRSVDAAARAATAQAELTRLTTQATSAVDTQATVLAKLSGDYELLLASDSLPSAAEIAEAQTESQDNADPATLYTRMTQLAATCSPVGN